MIRCFAERELEELLADSRRIRETLPPGTITGVSDLPEMPVGTAATVHGVLSHKGSKLGKKRGWYIGAPPRSALSKSVSPRSRNHSRGQAWRRVRAGPSGRTIGNPIPGQA